MYACGFRIYFTPLPGFFSPFPHGTGSLSVDHEYLALEDGPPIFRQDYTCPALLVVRLVPPRPFRIRDYHPLRSAFPDGPARGMAKTCRLFRFRSPLLSESRLISFPPLTEMFQFSGFASSYLCIQYGMTLHTWLSSPQLIVWSNEAFVLSRSHKARFLTHQKAIYEGPGFPIRTSADQRLFASSPRLFARYDVLLRL